MVICCKRCRGSQKPPPQEQVDITIHYKKIVAAKETPYGFINIFSGVRATDKKHTCPMLSVHLYRYSQFRADLAQGRQMVSIDRRNQLRVQRGPQKSREEEKVTAEEEVIMIPVEDVTQVSYKSEIKKDAQTDVQSTTTPIYHLSENCCDRCCAALFRRCCRCCSDENRVTPVAQETTTTIVADGPSRNAHAIEEHLPLPEHAAGCCANFFRRFRCWCCRERTLVDLVKRTNISSEQQAQRMVTISIDYSKYSNPDSASNARLLSSDEQEAYYKKRFQPDTNLEFYLITDTDLDPRGFEIKLKQAEALCRTVMQLKGMNGNYPSEDDLEKILDQTLRRTYGDVYKEPNLQLPLNQQAQLQLPSLHARVIERF